MAKSRPALGGKDLLTDLPLEQLWDYAPPIDEPDDFDGFWKTTLETVSRWDLDPSFETVSNPAYRLIEVADAAFSGYGGQRIRAWFLQPAGNTERIPCVVTFRGYGGGRSFPFAHYEPCVAGFAHFVMDNRGQGSTWSPGDTPDAAAADPQFPGFLTRGLGSPESYYYRRLITDAVRAVQAAASHPAVDPGRIAVCGASQGGGVAMAVAALIPQSVKLLLADVPFLCHFRRAIEITDQPPYAEITAYLACHRDRIEQSLHTLSYFDGCCFASRIRTPSLFSVALMDQTCPPSTVFAAYNRIPARKELRVYRYNGHEGGDVFQTKERMRFLHEHL